MALKQQQVLKQQQGLTQMQIQQIKLLEIPALEMEERILREIDNNPALELGEELPDPQVNTEEDFDLENEYPDENNQSESQNELSDYDDDYDDRAADYAETQAYDPNAESDRKTFLGVQTDSLQDFLRRQLSDLDLEETENWIGEYIIGCLDDDGYLRIQLDTIADQLSFHRSLDVEESQMEEVLTMIQDFEPAGIAARNLQECLLLQLQRKN
ncbi:MAG: RNA polymerase sigma-54 factor, partial [Bacteroidales bacterium]|nr:RNA polymerase sigma-54 factor [Bacteroidales bacterium]